MSKKAKPLKSGDAKLRGYGRNYLLCQPVAGIKRLSTDCWLFLIEILLINNCFSGGNL